MGNVINWICQFHFLPLQHGGETQSTLSRLLANLPTMGELNFAFILSSS